jgi:N-terminal acetyltransferase B complex non-catalytic subunit
MRPILLKLAHRLLTSLPPQIILTTADRFYLYLTVLIELELWEDADGLINDNIGTVVCSSSLACNELRRQMVQKRGLWEQEGKRARELIQEKK